MRVMEAWGRVQQLAVFTHHRKARPARPSLMLQMDAQCLAEKRMNEWLVHLIIEIKSCIPSPLCDNLSRVLGRLHRKQIVSLKPQQPHGAACYSVIHTAPTLLPSRNTLFLTLKSPVRPTRFALCSQPCQGDVH